MIGKMQRQTALWISYAALVVTIICWVLVIFFGQNAAALVSVGAVNVSVIAVLWPKKKSAWQPREVELRSSEQKQGSANT
jgi:hypothetical protein